MTDAQTLSIAIGTIWVVGGLILLVLFYIDYFSHDKGSYYRKYHKDLFHGFSAMFLPSAIIIWTLVGIYFSIEAIYSKSLRDILTVINHNRQKQYNSKNSYNQ